MTSLGEDSGASRPKCQSLPVAQDICFFCKEDGKSEQLHEFTIFNVNKSVKVMATEMNDTDLLVKMADGDIEVKYHFACLYRNRYRSHVRRGSSPANEALKRAKATAFAKTVSYIASALEDGTYIFRVAKVHKLYQSYLGRTSLSTELVSKLIYWNIFKHQLSKNSLMEKIVFWF